MRVFCMFLLVVLAGVPACKKESSDSGGGTIPPSQKIPLIAGTYSGTYSSNAVTNGSLTITLDLTKMIFR